ncbi:MAG: hypothetical protein ACE5JU_04580 [Candidatus Binatia bacterium]
MAWRVEWKALSDQILGLLEAGQFYLEAKSIRSDDPYRVADKQLMPQAQEVFRDLTNFNSLYKSALPSKAAWCLQEFLNKFYQHFYQEKIDAQAGIQFRLTALASFRSQFSYHLSDLTAVARHLSERAFVHLKRTIVADPDERRKWKKAFQEGETACEKLGASRLLLHGIWAFKVNAQGERTDLVFGEPIKDLDEIERTSEALVLTEWKKAHSAVEVNEKLTEAKAQAARYAAGSLAGLELADYRYLVVVTERDQPMPVDDEEREIRYRKINIAVDPRPPSRG